LVPEIKIVGALSESSLGDHHMLALSGMDSLESKQKISALQGKIDQLEKRDNILQKKLHEIENENFNLKKELLHFQTKDVNNANVFNEDKTE